VWWGGPPHGPVEHVKTGCERGHWFTPPVDSLDLEPVAAPAREAPASTAPALVPAR
jgi:hypothetical protein